MARDHEHGASASRGGVPVYAPAFAGTEELHRSQQRLKES